MATRSRSFPPSPEADTLSENDIRRFSRQILLKQVGGVGQERLLGTRAVVEGSGLAAQVASSYLRAAGVAVEVHTAPGLRLREVGGAFEICAFMRGEAAVVRIQPASSESTTTEPPLDPFDKLRAGSARGERGGGDVELGALVALAFLRAALGAEGPHEVSCP